MYIYIDVYIYIYICIYIYVFTSDRQTQILDTNHRYYRGIMITKYIAMFYLLQDDYRDRIIGIYLSYI